MTRKHGKKEIGKRLENDGLEYKEDGENTGLVERVRKKKEIAEPGEVATRTGLPATRKPPGLAGKNEQPRIIPCRTSSLDTSTHIHSASTQHNTTRPTTQRLGKTTKRTRTKRPHKQNPTNTLITQPSSVVFGLKILDRA